MFSAAFMAEWRDSAGARGQKLVLSLALAWNHVLWDIRIEILASSDYGKFME